MEYLLNNNTLLYKIIIYWFAIVSILYLIFQIEYRNSDTSLYYKYYKDQSFIGTLHTIIFYSGVIGIGMIYFAKITNWWFS